MLWLCIICAVLIFIVVILVIKIILLRKAIDEVRTEMEAKLETDTNTLIGVSVRDRRVRQLAASLNTQLRQLRKERRRFQNGDLELKEAVVNISHDLRTPLTAICGYLELLEREEKSEEISRYLEIIKKRTGVLKQLTEELFRYTIITSASNELNYEKVELRAGLEESLAAYYAAFKERGILPAVSLPEQKVWRKLDRSALSRIFGNILSNAIKYSDADLEITLSQEGEITFSNSASGLDEVQVGRLFDRFYTVEAARISTGLGLSIAKALTEQMNGRIGASYSEGKVSIQVIFPQ